MTCVFLFSALPKQVQFIQTEYLQCSSPTNTYLSKLTHTRLFFIVCQFVRPSACKSHIGALHSSADDTGVPLNTHITFWTLSLRLLHSSNNQTARFLPSTFFLSHDYFTQIILRTHVIVNDVTSAISVDSPMTGEEHSVWSIAQGKP